MSGMFYNSTVLNKNLGVWDTSSAATTRQMFRNAQAFQQDITTWNTSEVIDMHEMDGNFCEGDFVDVAGIRITAESIGKGVDYVLVSKTGKYVDPSAPDAGSKRGKPITVNNGCVYGQGAG